MAKNEPVSITVTSVDPPTRNKLGKAGQSIMTSRGEIRLTKDKFLPTNYRGEINVSIWEYPQGSGKQYGELASYDTSQGAPAEAGASGGGKERDYDAENLGKCRHGILCALVGGKGTKVTADELGDINRLAKFSMTGEIENIPF